ncbi:MAG: hypothetical protein CMA42_00810 [Euryarchaeota archaeon]|jgi:hypothetical protein|nr:hypothetical protein [Euryarchaeota archaeon]OUV68090.1 MAG: hypothetical protein CBC89_02805 [Euryarchaeota archaeon TMED129]
MTKAKKIAQKGLAKILRNRKESHGKLITDEDILKGVEVSDAGNIDLWICPPHPHCPCCLDGLIELRNEVNDHKNILACHIEIIGVPHSERWTAAVNE